MTLVNIIILSTHVEILRGSVREALWARDEISIFGIRGALDTNEPSLLLVEYKNTNNRFELWGPGARQWMAERILSAYMLKVPSEYI